MIKYFTAPIARVRTSPPRTNASYTLNSSVASRIALAIWMLVFAIRSRRRTYILPASTGIFGVLLAYGSGLAYWATEANIWSMSMTIGFTIAVTSYALAGRR